MLAGDNQYADHHFDSKNCEDNLRKEIKMDKETYEALKRLVAKTRLLLAEKYANRKRLNQDEIWEKATLTRDIGDVEGWIDEVTKEYCDCAVDCTI